MVSPKDVDQQAIQSITGNMDNETCLPKSSLQKLGSLGFIFDDQNSHDSPTSNENLKRNCIARIRMISTALSQWLKDRVEPARAQACGASRR